MKEVVNAKTKISKYFGKEYACSFVLENASSWTMPKQAVFHANATELFNRYLCNHRTRRSNKSA